MIVISDAGPLIALGKLGQLGLLVKLYDQILISRKVYEEVVVNGLRLGAPDAQASDFLCGYLTLTEVEFLLQEIKARPNLWISQHLCDQALAQARRAAQR